jgi:hypothetical protein
MSTTFLNCFVMNCCCLKRRLIIYHENKIEVNAFLKINILFHKSMLKPAIHKAIVCGHTDNVHHSFIFFSSSLYILYSFIKSINKCIFLSHTSLHNNTNKKHIKTFLKSNVFLLLYSIKKIVYSFHIYFRCAICFPFVSSNTTSTLFA